MLNANAGGRELPRMLPTGRAMPSFQQQYNDAERQPEHDARYEDGCSFREEQAQQLSSLVGSAGDAFVGPKQVRAAMKRVNADAAAGPTGANGASILLLYGSSEICAEVAAWISNLCRRGVDGLDDADPVDVRIRDTFICRSVMAMTKPGKIGAGDRGS